MTGNKYHKDKMFAKIAHTATSGVVGDAEYEVLGEVKLSIATTFTTSGTLTIQGRIKHSTSWQTIGTLTSGGDFDTFDIDAYDFIRFNFTVAAGSTGEIAASGFFKAAASGGATNTFATIQTDAGTSPVADSATDTLTLTSSDASITITGNSTTDTVDMVVASPGLTDPMTTRGDIIVRDATNTTARLAVGTAGQFLSSDGTDVSWSTPAGSGDVTGGASSDDNEIVRFSGTTGKVIQDTTVSAPPTINDSGELVTNDPSGTYLNVTQLGSGQTFTGEQSVVIGNTSNAKNFSVSVGYNAACDDTGCVAVGWGSTAGAAAADMCTAVGRQASATTTYSFAMGYLAASSGGTGSTSLGYAATATGVATFALGYQASATGTYSISIGANTNATHTKSIVVGRYAASIAANALTIGGNNGYDINTVLIGNNDTNATPSALTIRMTNGSGTNVSASNMTIQAGRGTGTGTGGHIIFQTAAAGASGSSLNSLTTQLEITDDGNIIMANLPTSASGLPTGALWNNSGVINIA